MYWEQTMYSQYMGGLKWKLCYKKSRVLASARMPPLMKTHLEPWKTNLKPWKPTWTHWKPDYLMIFVFLYFWHSFFAFMERYQQKDPTALIQKSPVTDRKIQLTSFDPKTSRHRQGDPIDLLWSKNVTSLTGGSNWPPLIQKRHVTDTRIQTF